MAAVTGGRIEPGDAVVIRYEGPAGGPGMREMLAVTAAIKGAGLGDDVLLLTDGRFSGATAGPVHRPRRARGDPRRPDRAGPRRGPDPAGHDRAGPSTCWSTRPSWSAAGPTGSSRRPGTRPAPWPSTPSSSAPPPRAPSAAVIPAACSWRLARRLGSALAWPAPPAEWLARARGGARSAAESVAAASAATAVSPRRSRRSATLRRAARRGPVKAARAGRGGARPVPRGPRGGGCAGRAGRGCPARSNRRPPSGARDERPSTADRGRSPGRRSRDRAR